MSERVNGKMGEEEMRGLETKESSPEAERSFTTHKDLRIWQGGVGLVEYIYRQTETFPRSETLGITLQLRRSAVSVPSNIAEGAARQSKKEFLRFLYIALGSLSEMETQLIISMRLGYLKDDGILTQVEVLRRQLLAFIKHQRAGR